MSESLPSALRPRERRADSSPRSAPRPLCARRKPGHRLRLRAVLADRAGRPVRAVPRPLRSAGQQHRDGAEAASAAHWFGTDQLGRDMFSRVIVATRLDFFIAFTSVALVFLWAGSPASPPAISAAGPTASSAGSPTPSWRSRCSCSRWASSRRSGTGCENIVFATAIVNLPLYARIARAEANVRREAGFVKAARLSGNGELRIVLGRCCRTSCRS